MEETVVLLIRKVFGCDNFLIAYYKQLIRASHFRRKTIKENRHVKELKI